MKVKSVNVDYHLSYKFINESFGTGLLQKALVFCCCASFKNPLKEFAYWLSQSLDKPISKADYFFITKMYF